MSLPEPAAPRRPRGLRTAGRALCLPLLSLPVLGLAAAWWLAAAAPSLAAPEAKGPLAAAPELGDFAAPELGAPEPGSSEPETPVQPAAVPTAPRSAVIRVAPVPAPDVEGEPEATLEFLREPGLEAAPQEEAEVAPEEVPETAAGETEPGSGGVEEGAIEPEAYSRTLKVRRGDTLISLMSRAGALRNEAEAAVRAMKPVYSPRKIKPGQKVHLGFRGKEKDDAGGDPLLSLRLEVNPERSIEVSRATPEAAFTAETVDRPLIRDLVGHRLRIESSLFVAGQEAGVPTAVMVELIRAFSFDIDFQREIWKGDGVELIYETFHDPDGTFVKTGLLFYAALEVRGKLLPLYRFTPPGGRADYFAPSGRTARRTLMRTPIDGARISSGFGRRRHPILGYTKVHRGVDFAAPRGTPIYAAGDGVVEVAGRKGAYGRYIRIRHNSTYKTAYAHLYRYAKGVRKGRRVRQGQVIGYVGTSGRSTGPHLHYEVHVNGRQTNPLRVKLPSGKKLKGEALAAFELARRDVDRLRDDLLSRAQLAEGTATLSGGLP